MKPYPFKFLYAYDKDDKDFFFGRQEEIDAMYEMVFQSNILLVFGASGTGKTSIIQCGLANRFKSHQWMAFNIRRGTDLNQSLQTVIGAEIDKLELDAGEQDGSIASSFRAIYLNYLSPIYLIFDQFEELYILGTREEQNIFIGHIQEILLLKQPVRIILSIRGEYMDHLYDFEKAVPQLQSKKIRIEPMDYEKVRQVILGVTDPEDALIRLLPNEKEAFIQKLFETVRGKERSMTIQLPYLQVFLDQLYESITHDSDHKSPCTFSLESLSNFDDLEDVLGRYLKAQVKELSILLAAKNRSFRENDCWKILSLMVSRKGTKIPVSKDDILQRLGNNFDAAFVDELIGQLINRRILRRSDNQDLYEIAHDSLGPEIINRPQLIQTKTAEDLVRNKYSNHKHLTQEDIEIILPVMSEMTLTAQEKAWYRFERGRLKRFTILRGILILVVISVLIYLLWLTSKEREKALAGEATVKTALDLQKKANLALDQQKQTADSFARAEKKANDTAQIAKAQAIANMQLARKNELLAKQNEQRANDNAEQAFLNERKALFQKRKADSFRSIADTNAAVAKANAQKAQSQQYLTQSITLALKSKLAPAEPDRILQALQSYFLNKHYNQGVWLPEIAEALIKASPAKSIQPRDSIGSAILDIIPAKDQIYLITDEGEIRLFHPDQTRSELIKKYRDFHYAPHSGRYEAATQELLLGDLNGSLHVFSLKNGFTPQPDRKTPSPNILAEKSGYVLTASGAGAAGEPQKISFEKGQYGAAIAIDPVNSQLAAGTRNGWLYLVNYRNTQNTPVFSQNAPVFKREFQNPNTSMNDIAFDRDGKFIATGGNDNRFRLTQLSLLQDRSPMEYAFNTWVTSVYFLDRMQVLIGTADGRLYQLNYDQDTLAETLRRKIAGTGFKQGKIQVDSISQFMNYLKNGQ